MLLIGILAVGLAGWIILPSLADQLGAQLSAYADRAATYVVVSNKLGGPSLGLAQNATKDMAGIQGVKSVFPFNVNVTSIHYHNLTLRALVNGTYRDLFFANFTEGLMSAPVGPGYFPPSLVNLVEGRMPNNTELGFVSNCGTLNLSTHLPMAIGDVFEVSVGGLSFNATLTGINALTPLTNDICILWNETFLMQKLGSTLFSETFGSPGANYVVLKVDRIEDVRSVVSSLTTVLKDFPGYVATYDEQALVNLEIFQNQSAPLYILIGLISPILAASISFLASYLSTGRRTWEPGLLLSLGWTRRSVLKLLLTYYGLISSIALVVAVSISYALSSLLQFRYEVYGAYLAASFSPSSRYLITSIPSAFAISSLVGLLEILRIRRAGVEAVLREF